MSFVHAHHMHHSPRPNTVPDCTVKSWESIRERTSDKHREPPEIITEQMHSSAFAAHGKSYLLALAR